MDDDPKSVTKFSKRGKEEDGYDVRLMKRGEAEAEVYGVRLMKRGVKKNKDYGVRLMRDEEGASYRGRLRKREDGGLYEVRKREEGGPYGVRLMKRAYMPPRMHFNLPTWLTSQWRKRENLPQMDKLVKMEYAPLMAKDLGVFMTENDESQLVNEPKIGLLRQKQYDYEDRNMKREYNGVRIIKRNYDGVRMMKRSYAGKKKKTYNGIRLMK